MQVSRLAKSIESTNYIPSEEALAFIAFIRATGNEENTSPVAHFKIADILFSPDEVDWNVIIECLRGMGKSTIVEYAVIYVAALGMWPNFGKVPFMVFLGASQEGNVKQFFKNVASKIENSPFLRELIEVARVTDSEIELINNKGVETILVGKGMSTNWRGVRSKRGARPTVLIADDILGNDVMTSQAVRDTVDTNWFNSALPALDPRKHKILYIGTPLSEDDLLHKLKNSKSYTVLKFPLCASFPVPEEDFVSIWPDRFTYKYVLKMYNQFKEAGKSRSFYTEYLLQLTDLSTLLVEPEDIRWYDHSPMHKIRNRYNFYITTDFATSTKKSADWSTIGVFAVSSANDWLLVDGQCKRQGMQENLDDLFRYVQKWNPLAVGIETSGQQGGFISILDDMMLKRNVWFTLAKKKGSSEPGIRPTKDKLHRFVTGVQPKFKQKKIWLPKPEIAATTNPNLYALLTELVDNELEKLTMTGGVAALAHDDGIDLLNQLSEIDTFAPSEDSGSAPVDPADGNDNVDTRYWGMDMLAVEEDSLDGYGSNIIF